ncbi:hypothetical protein KVR01_012896 [Diaporthe batatas]|uniref:uncharacterized protein n=1 Tax=Diaporthe batatas TaxID=748121 RepID=UPI001D03CCCA|nr:uncharacterized protein KVR01_012896 [Diaporthe batatas]KAG8157188.1 hypothetical protein KVR01_012896 [Diaporthe batatas]
MRSRALHLLWPLAAAAQSPPFGNGSCTGSPSTPVPYQLQTPPLDTPWTDQVGLNPWPEHPRPQLRRDDWVTLNGIWTYQGAGNATGPGDGAPPCAPLQYETLIPSCIESAISGLQVLDTAAMWFATTFDVPRGWDSGRSVLLNFEAVDYEATVYVNGQQVSFHRGGYFRNTIDVTSYLNPNGTNELKVFVFDPTDLDGYVIPIGKQTKRPEHIFYRPCSGIWQTVWLESAPTTRITQLDVKAGADGTARVKVHASGNATGQPVEVTVLDQDGSVLGSGAGSSGAEFEFTVDGVDPWSPDSPTLYNLTVTLGDDRVQSYTGFRTVGRGVVDGVQRPLLNGEWVFQWATLDQGFWPDGIHLAPNYEALIFDLQELKKLGFNAVRKHIKIEPDLFYYATDSLGLMVIQDMPGISPRVPLPNGEQQAEFERQLDIMINEHMSYTSIVTWVIYNEGWGQIRTPPYPEYAIADRIRATDGSRLIDATSGWYDHGAGDFSDNHHYANPQCGSPFYSIQSSPYDSERIGIQGEFGGIGHNVSIENLWNVQQAIDTINQTYEVNIDLEAYNYRAHVIFEEYRQQIEMFACSAGVWTQTTDVEGEVNGLVTYDRRVERVDVAQWQADIQALFDAAASRGGAGNATASMGKMRLQV